MEPSNALNDLLTLTIYTSFGIVVFAIAFIVMVKIAPFSVVKEIEDDQNTSLAILFGSVFIGLALIISSAIS